MEFETIRYKLREQISRCEEFILNQTLPLDRYHMQCNRRAAFIEVLKMIDDVENKIDGPLTD